MLGIDARRPLHHTCLFDICMWRVFLVHIVLSRWSPRGEGLPILLCKEPGALSVCSVRGPIGEGLPPLLVSCICYLVSVSNPHCLGSIHRKMLFFTVLFSYWEQYFTDIFNYARPSVFFVFLFFQEAFHWRENVCDHNFLKK